jgi:hypothetical protein
MNGFAFEGRATVSGWFAHDQHSAAVSGIMGEGTGKAGQDADADTFKVFACEGNVQSTHVEWHLEAGYKPTNVQMNCGPHHDAPKQELLSRCF